MSGALDRRFARYRAALCGSTLLMVGLSWPLWIDRPDFPRVPFFAGMPDPPSWVSWLVFVGIVTTLALATLGQGEQAMIRISLALLALAILEDQNRLQPWAYQYAIIGLMMTCLSKPRALRLARWNVDRRLLLFGPLEVRHLVPPRDGPDFPLGVARTVGDLNGPVAGVGPSSGNPGNAGVRGRGCGDAGDPVDPKVRAGRIGRAAFDSCDDPGPLGTWPLHDRPGLECRLDRRECHPLWRFHDPA